MAYLLAFLLTGALIAIDQITKNLVVSRIMPIGTLSVIDGFLSLTYVENTGAAFGIFPGGGVVFLILSILIIIGIGFYYISLPNEGVYKKMRFMLILIMAGAAGNMIDRIRHGFVIDYIHLTFINFPVFNIADMLIVSGTLCLAVLLFFFVKTQSA